MPDYRPLNDLRARLKAALVLPHGHRESGWAPPDQPMAAALKQTLRDFGSDRDVRPDGQAMVAAVRAFWRSREVSNFNQLKYVCYGLAVPVDADGTRVIDRAPLFTRLLELVSERQEQPKPFRRCYQGLLAGYFGYQRVTDRLTEAGANWLRLRGFLGERLPAVQAATTRMAEPPKWLITLKDNRNLLGEKPCARYVSDLRRGDLRELKAICVALDIESSSWVWHEALLASVQHMIQDEDLQFRVDMNKALRMVRSEDPDLRVPPAIAKEASALLVARYSRIPGQHEHTFLRDACIQHIGNPWLDRAAWDSTVRDEQARRMVESWLKRGLIKDFFELLSHDGAADARRLNYWLKWEPQISDMWFALGGDAQLNRSAEFRSIRERMKGRDRRLQQATAGDNAFIMRIGELYIVEFGLKGTACFVFDESGLPLDLEQRDVSLSILRAASGKLRLIHRGQWESDFDLALRNRIHLASLPAATMSAASAAGVLDPTAQKHAGHTGYLASRPSNWDRLVREFAAAQGLNVEDRRHKGGAYWVRTQGRVNLTSEFEVLLRSCGFRHAPPHGYYLETDD